MEPTHDTSDEIARLRAEAADPATPPERQYQLASDHPEVLEDLATHPYLYEDLRAWMASLGDPRLDAALELGAARAAAAAEPQTETPTPPREDGPRTPADGVDVGGRGATGPMRTSVGIRRSRGSTPVGTGAARRAATPTPAAGSPRPLPDDPAATRVAATPVADDPAERGSRAEGAWDEEWDDEGVRAWERRRRLGWALLALAVVLLLVGILWTTGVLGAAGTAAGTSTPPGTVLAAAGSGAPPVLAAG